MEYSNTRYPTDSVRTFIQSMARSRGNNFFRGLVHGLAKVLGVDRRAVNVKVKSGEGLDAVGRGEAIAAQAVCLIEPT